MKKKEKSKPSKQVKEKQDYAELLDKYVRFGAEFDNYKKRSFKEKADFVKYANQGLIMELLSILDNFERGIKSAEQKKDYALLHQGVNMISKQLHSLLETKGLSRIKSVGEKFDPHQHEAVEVIEGDDEGAIIEELQSGYLLSGRIIRPARVKVIKVKQEEKEEEIEEKKEESEKDIEEKGEKKDIENSEKEGEEKEDNKEEDTENRDIEEEEMGIDKIKDRPAA